MSFQLNSSQGEEAEHWTFRGSGLCPLKFDPVATYCYFLVKGDDGGDLINYMLDIINQVYRKKKGISHQSFIL